jgi:tetratricopeptide (TPR) repeat protein
MKINPRLEDPMREARLAVHRGRFREAVDRLTALGERLESSPEWLLLMSMARWRLGDFAASHRLADYARIEYRSRGDADGEMRAQNVAAAGEFARGRLHEARAGFERAAYLARQLSDTLMMARCTNNIGNVDFYLGNNADALVLYANATNLFEYSRSLRGITEAWHNTAIVWREQGDFAAARKAADRAMDAAERLDDARLLAQTLASRGETDALIGDTRLASVQANRALDLARGSDDRLTECHALRVLGLIARSDGQYQDALRLGREAVEVALQVQNQWMTAKAREELGESLTVAGQPGEARVEWAAAIEAYTDMGAEARAERLRQRIGDLTPSG